MMELEHLGVIRDGSDFLFGFEEFVLSGAPSAFFFGEVFDLIIVILQTCSFSTRALVHACGLISLARRRISSPPPPPE